MWGSIKVVNCVVKCEWKCSAVSTKSDTKVSLTSYDGIGGILLLRKLCDQYDNEDVPGP